ncbi:uroporphyrinogen-III synthase [Halobacillus yeomjeoni]|uniref:Uroporphyrinogen-III synthase n=1 Tax=Halobacillus yeomjeoni TaxID=311194 RepID=A0A931HUH4_9BACI|nr:uroporphyrinogen-III synthase [Halobacillus yeomjeoni]MBH0230042.1 uroporphyrinogen-III synthase [Halobacillus yeomjeoni]
MKPLAGKHVLITRGRSQARVLSRIIEREGGVAIETPLLSFQLNDTDENQEILGRLHEYQWVFITSSNGVKFFFELVQQYNSDLSEDTRFAIIGSKTNRMLKSYGYEADFIPSEYNAEVMIEEFFEKERNVGKILYVRGSRSRDLLPEAFRERGVFFQSITVYDTLLMKDANKKINQSLTKGSLDALTFTSPSAIQAYMAIVKGMENRGLSVPCFCIGPTTARKAEEAGFEHVHIPEQYTIENMVEQMRQYFTEEGER